MPELPELPALPPRETPTDLLMRSLEQVEHAEDCIIVFRKVVDGKDEIDWVANDIPAWKITGMLQFAQLQIVAYMNEED